MHLQNILHAPSGQEQIKQKVYPVLGDNQDKGWENEDRTTNDVLLDRDGH